MQLLKLLGLVAVVSLAVVFGLRAVVRDPAPDDVEAQIRAWRGVGLDARAVHEVRRLVDAGPRDVARHYRWITAHFASSGPWERDDDGDQTIRAYYRDLAKADDPQLADIGRYGLGLIAAAGDRDFAGALDLFAAVENRELRYLNNSTGRCLIRLGRPREAIPYLEREIALGGNLGGASRNLAEAWIGLGERRTLVERIESDPEFRGRMLGSTLRRVSLWQGDVGGYLRLVVGRPLSFANVSGVAAAVMILGVWLVFLRRLDLFEPERPRALGVVLVLGMATATLCTVFYDVATFGLGAKLTGDPLLDLLFCVLVIGLIEEAVKLLPLAAAMRWTRWVDEPVDVPVYAATSALGFAFVENVLYFGPLGLSLVHGRAFTATILHMALSAIASYGLLRARSRGWSAGAVVLWFSVAVLLHGVYDFVLVGEGWVRAMRALSLVVLVLAVAAFRKVMANGLSWSPFWTRDRDRRIIRHWWYLGISLFGVILVEFVLLGLQFGPTAAGFAFLSAGLTSWFLILLLMGELGTIQVVRHRWLPLFERPRRRRPPAPHDGPG